MALFEVIHDGKVKMHTSELDCIYPMELLKHMQAAGYRFRMDGKVWFPGEILRETDDGQLML